MLDALAAGAVTGLANYPTTAGAPALREAIAAWLVPSSRAARARSRAANVLPVLGSREALFAFAQTVVDASRPGATVVMPNPFYQIYEGAALLAGALPYCVNAASAAGEAPSLARRSRRRLVADAAPVRLLARQSHRSRAGSRRVARAVRAVRSPWLRHRLRRMLFGGLSSTRRRRRSARSAPRTRSGAAGSRASSSSAACRSAPTRRGCAPATSPATRRSSRRSCSTVRITARRCRPRSPPPASPPGTTKRTCVANRAEYAAKFATLQPRLAAVASLRRCRDAAFYLWASDARRRRRVRPTAARRGERVRCCPAAFLARDAHGANPGRGRIRIALVASHDECAEAIERIIALARRG